MPLLTSPVGRAAVALAATVFTTASCSAPSDSPSASSSTSTSTESAVPPSAGAGGSYLALGDSVPFGLRTRLPDDEYRDAKNFQGYPELVGKDLGLDVINATCPGETTASFVDVTAKSNGCENGANTTDGYRDTFPLHVAYDTADQSQLAFAVETLKRADDVRLVTLQIGANDAFVCQSSTADHCQAPAEYQAMGQTIQANLGKILSTLRGEGQYDGQIVVVDYYAFDYTSSWANASSLLNSVISGVASANGATVADAFAAFQKAAAPSGGNSVKAGLLPPNDVHPTEKGQRLLADTVESVVAD